MRQLLVLAAVVTLAAANPRERRSSPPGLSEYRPCRHGKGVCVPYYLCVDDTVITDGAGIFDIRLGPTPGGEQDIPPPECEHFIHTCCQNPNLDKLPPVDPNPEYTSTCGRRNSQGIDVRIQGFQGDETQVGEFPWMTAVLKSEIVAGEEINLYLCGGSLIHPSIVLTAAHCINKHDYGSLRVRLGEWDTQNEHEPYKHQERAVQNVIIHEGFNPSNLVNDFALLHLATPAVLSKYVDIICLDGDQTLLQPYHSCLVTGWGKDRFGKKGIFQNVLKKIDLPVVDHQTCENNLRTTRLGAFFKLDHTFMCAGGEPGKDSCSGDGGSPLVCLDSAKGQYAQVGIVAWGIGCGEANIPGVYANVVNGYPWIVDAADRLLIGGQGPIIDHWKYV